MHSVHRASRFAHWLLSGVALFALAAAPRAHAEDQGYGYVWGNNPTAAAYTPDPPYAYNEAGTRPTVTRTGVGRYDVTFPGLAATGTTRGNVQVTAYGSTSHYCKLRSWSSDTASVACFNASGTAADTQYSVLFLEPDAYENHYAFALADQPTTASYTPIANKSYNPGGGTITAIHPATGEYAIHFGGFAAIGTGKGQVQVTAHGSGNARCRLESWLDESAQVRCRNAAGAPVDSAYSILFWRPEADEEGIAFAWANRPSTASYAPIASYAHEASGSPITATRLSTGVYRMQWIGLEGVGIHGGNVQVTAYGTHVGTAAHCKVAEWNPTTATIRCFDTAGNRVDAYFSVLFVKPPKKPWSQEYAFAYASLPSAYLYAPSAAYSHNPLGEIEITRASVGDYNVRFENFDDFPGGGNAQVTAVDTTGKYCKVESSTDDDVRVRCFTHAGGALSDTRFTVLFVKTSTEPTAVAYAYAHDPFTSSYEYYAPIPHYAYNPSGSWILVTRWGGLWRTLWDGFEAFGVGRGLALVTAVGLDSGYCGAADWEPDNVDAYCVGEVPHSVLYLRPDADDDGMAFGRTPYAAPAFYSVPVLDRFNAGGGRVTSERIGSLGSGRYRMTFQGMARRGFGGGHVQVMATDPDAHNHCAIESWGAESVDVFCSDYHGASETPYVALFIKPVALPLP